MKVNNSTAATGNTALVAATTAKKSAMGAFEKNSKEFGPIAASAIGVGKAAVENSSTLSKVVNSVENSVKEAANNTIALANDSTEGLKSAYNKVSSGVSSAASGIGSAASAIAGYADAGLSATVQTVSALV